MSFNKTAIYTSGPLPQNRQTSHQFKTYGAVGAPTSVGELRISMATPTPRPGIASLLGNLPSLVMSVITGTSVMLKESAALPATKLSFDLSPRPELNITVPPKIPESKLARLTAAGFVPRIDGRMKYYSGPSTDDGLAAAMAAEAQTDNRAPGNAVSINGLVTFSVMSRVLFHVFCVFYAVVDTTAFGGVTLGQFREGLEKAFVPNAGFSATSEFKRGPDSLPQKGFFFPYFDGLVLPDQGFTLSWFCTHFSSMFGTKPAHIAEAMRTFGSGWSSLRNTIAGKEMSHMVFCLSLAIPSSCAVLPVYMAGQYRGCVFYTDSHIVTVGSQVHVPCDNDSLKEQVMRMESHESALEAICDIIRDLPTVDSKVDLVDPSLILTPRILHNKFRNRAIPPETTGKLAPLIRKLRFTQQLWDISNPKHIQAAVKLIVSKSFPDDSTPMNLALDAVYTKQPIFSVLGAFGTKAPSLRGSGSQIVRRIAPRFYENLDKPGRLTGIPIFAKSHQEAKEDWESILSEATIFFDTKGKDKEGKLRVKHLASSLPFDTDEAKGIMGSLLTVIKKRKSEEVSDDKPEKTQAELDEDQKRKRRRQKGVGYLGMGLGIAQVEDIDEASMDMDAADEDIY